MEKALTQKLGYNARVIDADDNIFFNILKSNMMNGLPAQLAIDRSAPVSSHSLVADGYNSGGFFHHNFGWGTDSPDVITDAWYHLPESMGAGFNIVDYAVADIQPPGEEINQLLASSNLIQLEKCRFGQFSIPHTVQLINNGQSPIQIDYIITGDHFFISTVTSAFTDSLGEFTIQIGRAHV